MRKITSESSPCKTEEISDKFSIDSPEPLNTLKPLSNSLPMLTLVPSPPAQPIVELDLELPF